MSQQVQPSDVRVALAMPEELAARQFTEAEWDRLREIADPGDRVLTEYHSASAAAVLAEVEVLITSWGAPRIDATALSAAPKLRAIVHAAGTVRFLVADEVWDAGISVSSMADLNGLPVAEYTLAMILLENKRVLPVTEEFRRLRDRPAEEWYEPDAGNYRKRVGLISASRIGRRVAELLRPFDLEVVIADPFCDAAEIAALGATKIELDELISTSDIVSLHAPLLPETIGMIGTELLQQLRDGATLINTARGKIIDHDALITELRTGRFRAVLDVTDPEPPPADSPLWDLPNVVLTPHLAGSKGAEIRRMANGAIDEVARIVRGEPLQFQVPPERRNTVA
ncbi:hydroxyacid dehydrogenase [Microlunatus soli]|uniref:hydroxyacid dehydrogenase n=1 Tax=Microlunatus soli TaxID=630515 RepID=UPI0018D43790|nr:hydroxyacid dehydrogenase [Microlunatus soli]